MEIFVCILFLWAFSVFSNFCAYRGARHENDSASYPGCRFSQVNPQNERRFLHWPSRQQSLHRFVFELQNCAIICGFFELLCFPILVLISVLCFHAAIKDVLVILLCLDGLKTIPFACLMDYAFHALEKMTKAQEQTTFRQNDIPRHCRNARRALSKRYSAERYQIEIRVEEKTTFARKETVWVAVVVEKDTRKEVFSQKIAKALRNRYVEFPVIELYPC